MTVMTVMTVMAVMTVDVMTKVTYESGSFDHTRAAIRIVY
jgi:hypothetical protein